jgi:hypothetical protein
MAESIIINPGDRNSEMAAKRTSPGAQSRKILSSPQNGKNVSHWVDGRLPVRMGDPRRSSAVSELWMANFGFVPLAFGCGGDKRRPGLWTDGSA